MKKLESLCFWFIAGLPYIILIFIYNKIPSHLYELNKHLFIIIISISNILGLFIIDKVLKKQNFKFKYLFKMIFTTLVSLIYSSILLLSISSFSISISSVIIFLIGCLCLTCGFYLPYIEQNPNLGIRTKWTLDNKIVWEKTHKLGNITWIIGGILYILSIFIHNEYIFKSVILTGILLFIIIPGVFSYVYWKKLN